MLEKIREGSQGIIAKTILVLIILAFVFTGVGGYLTNNYDDMAASVNGEKITQNELERSFANEKARMQAQFKDMYQALAANEAYMNSLRTNVLEKLINESLQDQASKDLGLRVSDEQIKTAIRELREFQTDGKFDNERYLSLLRQAGYSVEKFRESMRADMTRQQLVQGIVASNFVIEKEKQHFAELENETRQIQMVTVSAEPLKKDVEVTEEQIKGYYDLNSNNYRTEEKVKVDYVLLKASDFNKDVKVTDEEIQQYYDSQKSRYKVAERRRASHILIEVKDDEAKAKEKITALKAKLDAGEDFAKLAKENSDDTFSGEKGGDLDWFEKDAMDKAFGEAVFALKEESETTDVVRSSFGFHLIKLTGIQAEKVKPLDEVKSKVVEMLQEQHAAELFLEKRTSLEETAFEIPDTLDDAASAADAKVQSTELVTRFGLPAPLNQPQVSQAIFSSEVLQEGINSSVIELDDQSVIVVRIAEHEASRVKKLDEVKDQVKEAVIKDKATELAKTKAQDLLKTVREGQSLEEVAKAQSHAYQAVEKLTRNSFDVTQEVRKRAFSMAVPGENDTSIDAVDLANGDVAVVRLVSKTTGTLPDDLTNVGERLARASVEAQYKAFIDSLRNESEILVAKQQETIE